jgi:hypothetical protein
MCFEEGSRGESSQTIQASKDFIEDDWESSPLIGVRGSRGFKDGGGRSTEEVG